MSEALLREWVDKFELLTAWLDVLVPYAVDVRYPGGMATPDEAREAVQAARKVRTFVRARLGLP